MNKIEQENLMALAHKYNNICVNINEFCDMLKPPFDKLLEPVTKRDILQTGRYGKLYSANIWVSKFNASGCVRVSNENIYDLHQDENKWSPSVPLNMASITDLNRLFNLKSFW
jgi:hypothetical protein